jgi:tRNA threonylcarbamoyladenosine biosynthesis protein TsaE
MVYMSTGATLQINSTSSNETELLGECVGKNLKGGEVIELVSDLGGGKTTFVHGLAKGMGSLDNVSSPSFTLKQQYYSPELTLHHYDFYRLQEAGVMQHELAEVINDPAGVVVVEWGDVAEGVLPAKRMKVHIKTTGETTRQFQLICPEPLKYLLEGLK